MLFRIQVKSRNLGNPETKYFCENNTTWRPAAHSISKAH